MLIGILLSFVPWIIFKILAGHSLLTLDISIVVSVIAAIALGFRTLRKGYILAWATLIFFLFCFISVTVFGSMRVVKIMDVLPYSYLGIVSLASLIAGRPFTSQFAKERVPKDKWNSRTFKNINLILTSSWTIVFFAEVLFIAKKPFSAPWMTEISTDIILLFGIVFTMIFPDLYKKKFPESPVTEQTK